jgi:signal transduction histidine kinase
MSRWKVWPLGIGWLTGLSVGAILAINLAGLGGIALARRGVLDEAEKVLALETSARARSLESRLSASRADLTYLTGSPIFFGLESALLSQDPREARMRRLEAEGSLLLFLRGHPEVTHLNVDSQSGAPLLVAARRGGIPVLWMTPEAAASGPIPAREVDAATQPLTAHFTFREGERTVSGAVTLEATLDAARLLSESPGVGDPSRGCLLKDKEGKILARESPPESPAPGGQAGELSAHARVAAEGWSEFTPWELICRRNPAGVLARVEPLAGRYRMTLLLNAAVMSLALLLGAFAIQQTQRRARLEADARQEGRVRELERQLFHAERLSTVGRLAAGIAHEINNPLEGMSNYLHLARQDLTRNDGESARQRLDGIQEGLKRAETIVRRVLAHADPSAAPRTPVLGEILGQSLGFIRERPEFDNIRFDLDLPPEPLVVEGNPAMLGQVFLNLLLNACEAQPEGGEVRVAARREKDGVVAEIADRGPGVPDSEAARVFEPFYTTKNSTGLGLSICYSIARQHGAELKTERRAGGGAVFKMIFKSQEPRDG